MKLYTSAYRPERRLQVSNPTGLARRKILVFWFWPFFAVLFGPVNR